MLTHNGLFFDNQVHERSYYFTQNEKHTIDKSVLSVEQTTYECLIGIYFLMQNTLQYYERNYDRIQDVLSDIVGVSSIVVTIGFYINLLTDFNLSIRKYYFFFSKFIPLKFQKVNT